MSNQPNQSREDAKAARLAYFMEADFSAASSIDELWAPQGNHLTSDEIKALTRGNASFKKRLDYLNNSAAPAQLLDTYRGLTEAGQKQFYDRATPAERAIIDADVKAFLADAETQEQRDAKAAEEQAVADRVAAEQAAVAQDRNEKVYPGLVKGPDGYWRVTIDPRDGSPAEVFKGVTQEEVWEKLVKSKANATAELRRRKQKAVVTPELKAEFELMNWPPLVEYVELSPEEQFDLTEDLKDPSKMLQAQRRLLKASLTKEEVDRQNNETIRNRIAEGRNTTIAWMHANAFFNCPENVAALNDLLVRNDIFPTPFNLSKALETMRNQGIYVEAPDSESSAPVAAPTAAPSTRIPVPQAPVAPQPSRVVRPASNSTSGISNVRMTPSAGKAAAAPGLTPEQYHAMPSSTLQIRYKKEPAFRAEVDALIASGKV